MSWPVRTNRFGFADHNLTANVPVTVGTVPTGKTWLFKDWTAFNNTASARILYFIVTSGSVTLVVHAVSIPAGGVVWPPRELVIVMIAGDQLKIQSNVGGSLQLGAYGAQLG